MVESKWLVCSTFPGDTGTCTSTPAADHLKECSSVSGLLPVLCSGALVKSLACNRALLKVAGVWLSCHPAFGCGCGARTLHSCVRVLTLIFLHWLLTFYFRPNLSIIGPNLSITDR